MSLFPELNELISRYGFIPKKRFSQNFLIDEKAIDDVVKEADLKTDDVVLEIGGGTGFLTRKILERSKVICVEIDESLVTVLKRELKGKDLEIIHADFLELKKFPKFNKVVSSPPYNISTDILLKLFPVGFEKAVFVFQKEFVERLTALPGFYDYNALSVLTQYFTEPKVVRVIPQGCFYPRPESQSAIVVLDWRKRFGKAEDDKAFMQFVKQVFRFSNKNLMNALLLSFDIFKKDFKWKTNKEKFKKKLIELEIPEEKVGLTEIEDLVAIFNDLY